MSTEVMSQQAFQERMTERLREDVGRLIPDDKLAQLVEQAIQSMFFTRKVEPKTYGRDVEYPSWWEKAVHDTLKDMLRAHISGWITANADRLEKALEESMRKEGPTFFAHLLVEMIGSRISAETFNVQQRIEAALRSGAYG